MPIMQDKIINLQVRLSATAYQRDYKRADRLARKLDVLQRDDENAYQTALIKFYVEQK